MASVFTDSGEISGQRQKKLDEAAGRRMVATGIAAAFAAGLAILVSPVGGAVAAPPATQVDVVNPATSPALTRNVDDPGRIAYQSSTTCVLDSTTCTFDFPPVPKNHRLVVQHVSVELLFGADARGAQISLGGGANGAVSSFIAPPSFLHSSLFNQSVLQYYDAGSAPFVFAFADISPSPDSLATISGYLLDCATTPCAAIAQ
jgi:hypothetical protein